MPWAYLAGRVRHVSRDTYEALYGHDEEPRVAEATCDACGNACDIADLVDGPGGAMLCPDCAETGKAAS
jgi:hypothetical protein